jgi:hypothetical protein
MQRKKNIFLSVSLVILVAACFGVYYMKGADGSDVDKNKFRPPDLTAIDRVVITGPRGNVELAAQGSRWRVNNQFTADANLIDVLFATLQQAEARRPVAVRMRESVSRQLDSAGTRVQLFAGENEEMTFLAGGNATRTEAYFREPDSKIPYVMVIPGYRVYVSGIFELPAVGWRERHVFALNWMNFNTLDASFPDDPRSDFSVLREGNAAVIDGMANADTTRLNDFMDAISFLTADEFVEADPDSIRSLDELMHVIVKDVAGRQYVLELYSRDGNESPVYGVVDSSAVGVFNREKIEPILRKKSWFRPN